MAIHTARPGSPYPIVAVALVGPKHLVPQLPLGSRSYTLLEGTPLYFGVASKQAACSYVSDVKAAVAEAALAAAAKAADAVSSALGVNLGKFGAAALSSPARKEEAPDAAPAASSSGPAGKDEKRKEATLHVGDLVEQFAFGGPFAPEAPLEVRLFSNSVTRSSRRGAIVDRTRR